MAKKMPVKDIAVIYGAQWIGKGADKAITMFLTDPYDKVVTIALAAGLPVATRFIKMPETAEKVAILVGGYLSTRIVDYAEQYLAPAVTR